MTLPEGGWEGTYDTCILRPGGPLGLILSVSGLPGPGVFQCLETSPDGDLPLCLLEREILGLIC